MKYNIISINDTRYLYKKHIRETVGFEEVLIPSVDARAVNLEYELKRRDLFISRPEIFSIGEVGIWLSMFDCWQWAVYNDEALITFEDDAEPRPFFDEAVERFSEELPADYDFLSLWVPDNQRKDYYYDVVFDDEGEPDIRGLRKDSLFDIGAFYIARAYNGYGNVATLFSPKGAQFFIDRTREVGLRTPVDCFLYQESHTERCKGYAPKPIHATAVDYSWPETTVHTTERFNEVYK